MASRRARSSSVTTKGELDVLLYISFLKLTLSFLDILYLGRIFPKRASIMAKRELIWAPLLGQYREPFIGVCAWQLAAHNPVAASGAVFVDRKNKNNALASLTKAGDDMKRRGVSWKGFRAPCAPS
jgi:hypothetical protein